MKRFAILILLIGCNQEKRPISEEIFAIEKPSIQTCGKCHKDVHDEWAKTLHATAWINSQFRTSTKNYSKTECIMCHSTMPILYDEKLRFDKDFRPEFRPVNMEDAVNCLTCHGLPYGVAASRTIPDAPCKPIKEPRLRSAEFCATCHNPTHFAYDEWKTTKASKQGYDCISCHMTAVERETPLGKKTGKSHYMPGGFDKEMVKRAVSYKVQFDEGKLKIQLVNFAGHKFPGEVGFRSFVIKVTIFDEKENESRYFYTTLRRALKDEVGWTDNSLKPDEKREIAYDIPEKKGSLRVRFLFKQFPIQRDPDSILVGEWKTDLK